MEPFHDVLLPALQFLQEISKRDIGSIEEMLLCPVELINLQPKRAEVILRRLPLVEEDGRRLQLTGLLGHGEADLVVVEYLALVED